MANVNETGFGVYELLTELCRKTSSLHCAQSNISQNALTSKMRSLAYEIILKKTSLDFTCSQVDPSLELLSYCFMSRRNAKNVAEYKRSSELKEVIDVLRNTDFSEYRDNFKNMLKLLIGLQKTSKLDLKTEIFQRPFSFGLLDEMLPKLPKEEFGSPQPYSYYPSYVFELPFTMKKQVMGSENKSSTYTEYTVESFDSRSHLVKTHSEMQRVQNIKSFMSPKSFASFSSIGLTSYRDNDIFNLPRLTAPRDIRIPSSSETSEINVKVSFPPSSSECRLEEMYRATETNVDIWEIATQVDKNIPENIWDIVSKMSFYKERQIIATSTREIILWQKIYSDELAYLYIISEKQFIRHIMYLIIGVETSSFPFSEESNCFYMKDNLVLEGISKEHLKDYVTDLLLVGTYYKRLNTFAFNQTADHNFQSNGIVLEAAREVIRRYLLDFRLSATKVYENCSQNISEELNCMPTLLHILHHIAPLKHEIETIASIYKVIDMDRKDTLPHGAELMSYLFNEISLVTHHRTALTLFNTLFSVCKVYFKFIERFIFEGELDDVHNEFFIRKDNQYVNSRSKRYWDKGFHVTLSVTVPEFLRSVVKYILLCGKSLRLLKLCNPSDPLVLLISSDHPSVKCCTSFDELERQQQVLDAYRTRCLFVSGEPVTFDQILLKKEAERKAFTEMASLKQAETMEKIVAERKRLAQLIIAGKQHSLRVLEAAMAEAKAAKNKARLRERKRYELEAALEKATEEVDSKLKDDERNKIMTYYSKLNMEVEKSKIHTEWKIKRLQLDQSRIQLLSTEERNLKREKLELEHKRNGENMELSIESLDLKFEKDPANENNNNYESVTDASPDSTSSMEVNKSDEHLIGFKDSLNMDNSNKSLADLNKLNDVVKTISTLKDNNKNDNNMDLDSQGNVLNVDVVNNQEKRDFTTSSNVIGGKLDNAFDNQTFMSLREEAIKNKEKVMAHEFGQTDEQNNKLNAQTPVVQITSVDEENNVQNLSTFSEAKKNKLKVLGTEFGVIDPKIKRPTEPRTDAQREAVINKQRVLGVEYNLPTENVVKKEPANIAQEEALRNKNKVLSSEYNTRLKDLSPRREANKKTGLTLNLKPFVENTNTIINVAPDTGSITPGELFPRLDLETPTTAEVPLDSGTINDIFTPKSDGKDLESDKHRSEKEYLTSEGFDFSIIVDDETVDEETDVPVEDSPDSSPTKVRECLDLTSLYFYNLIEGTYNFEHFDPFGIKKMENYSKNYLTDKINNDMKTSFYTNPALIMEEVKKKPYNNIFVSSSTSDEETSQKITTNNIATLTACLQRSVMLPLTYQLEVVNNSILTHFLVNLDMYEHLGSLKDYFFLMDGEFSRCLCNNLFTKLTKTLNPQELLNFATLHNILDQALRSSISHLNKFSENLSFTISESPLSFQHSSPDVLQCLSLTYSVSWPLNIILSPEALLRYAKMFQFLIKMRRVFWVLSEDFESLKLAAKLSREHSRRLLRSPHYISVQIYRHVMASLVRALDNYIVTTCILTSWKEFENDLKKARTLDDLYDCHVAYIKKVLFRCLLNNRSTPVMKLLNDIFTVVLKFSRVLKAGEWQQKERNGFFIHTNYQQLEELYHLFEKLTKYLHKVVAKLVECGYQRHLVELLTMINHRRLSYSRHAVNDRDLGTQVNYKTHMNIRRLVGDRKHHHKRSKRGKQDGKNHVTFPEFQQNGSAKQFTHAMRRAKRSSDDYIDEVLQEDEDREPRREDNDGGITFTAKSPPGYKEVSPTSSHKENSSSLLNQLANLPGFNPLKARIVKQYAKTPEEILPTAVEKSLPWRRDRSTYNFVPNEDILEEDERRMSEDTDTYMIVAEQARVTTPTATETMLPWKREETEGSGALKQSEFPAWASNKEYLAYNSPSATFLGGIEKPKHPKSIIGLFRRESSSSTQGAPELPSGSETEGNKMDGSKGESSSVKGEPTTSRVGPNLLSKRSTSLGGPSVLLMEDVAHSDPLGASSRPASIMQGPHRGQCRRGSMLELTGSLSRDAITEEKCCKSLPESERMGVRRLTLGQQSLPREPFIRQMAMTPNLLSSSSSDESSDENT